jgi:pilus assembly protein Flp/PilA
MFKREITMHTMIQFLKDEKGATAIEYGLIAALISVAAIVAMTNLGQNLSTTFSNVATGLSNAR